MFILKNNKNKKIYVMASACDLDFNTPVSISSRKLRAHIMKTGL